VNDMSPEVTIEKMSIPDRALKDLQMYIDNLRKKTAGVDESLDNFLAMLRGYAGDFAAHNVWKFDPNDEKHIAADEAYARLG